MSILSINHKSKASCQFGDKCNLNDPKHYQKLWHPEHCFYEGICKSTKFGHKEWFHRQKKASPADPSIQAISQISKCAFGNQCDQRDPKHFQTIEHPSGPCSSGSKCQSNHFGHLIHFEHTPEQKIKGFTSLLGDKNTDCVDQLGIGKTKNMLSHAELESLYNTTTQLNPSQQSEIFKETGFSQEFLRSAFYHGVRIASEQFKEITSTQVTLEGTSKTQSFADLLKNKKIKFQFGPSPDALKRVLNKLKSSQKTKTIAPLANPKLGEFKWEETKVVQGIQKLDPSQGVHLLTGCYHSTQNEYANSIFNEVKMVGGGYLGPGMYFTCSPTKNIGADDLGAVLKTSSYGLSKGGVLVVALVIGHNGINYVSSSDSSQPFHGNWDLKYLPKGIKGGLFGASSEKHRRAAELVATDPDQVIPLGIIFVEGSDRTLKEKKEHELLLKNLQSNAEWIKKTF